MQVGTVLQLVIKNVLRKLTEVRMTEAIKCMETKGVKQDLWNTTTATLRQLRFDVMNFTCAII